MRKRSFAVILKSRDIETESMMLLEVSANLSRQSSEILSHSQVLRRRLKELTEQTRSLAPRR